MKQLKIGLFVAVLGVGSSASVLALDKDAQKDRIDENAEQKKARADRKAERHKAGVEEDAERAKSHVDGRPDGKASVAQPSGGVGEEVTETWITTKVKASFVGEDALKGSDISVDTENKGIVLLTGTAPTTAARVRAASIAASVKGVKGVRNEIRIAPAR
jgi:osmotically-inducible protein OsmY